MNIGVSNPNKGGGGGGAAQFTAPQVDAILELIYKNNVSTFGISPVSNEKAVLTVLNLNFNIQGNDDVFTAASINQGIGSILADVNGGNKTRNAGNSLVTKAFVMTLNYNRKGVPLSENKTVTFFAYTPQFAGVSSSADLTTYATMSTDLQKFVQSSPVLVKQSSPAGQYIWFISTKNNAAILDQNNFQQTVGAWNDGVSEFYLKSISLLLADGVTSETVYVYRSRNVKTLTNFTYKIQ